MGGARDVYDGGPVQQEGSESRGKGWMGGALVHVAFGVGLGAQVLWSLFCRVGHALVQVGQRDGVLLVDVALKLGLQAGSLIVGERQRDEGLGLTHELVNVALPCHLERAESGRGVMITGTLFSHLKLLILNLNADRTG